MLSVYVKDYKTKKDRVLGTFQDITELYHYFSKYYGRYKLADRFSHNPYDYYNVCKYLWDTNVKYHYMVIVNERGIHYSQELVRGMFNDLNKKQRERAQKFSWVPGAKKHSRCSFHRRPKTKQERTFVANIVKEDGEPKWRDARIKLPTSWDDLNHYDHYNRNWKRYRKTRWK